MIGEGEHDFDEREPGPAPRPRATPITSWPPGGRVGWITFASLR